MAATTALVVGGLASAKLSSDATKKAAKTAAAGAAAGKTDIAALDEQTRKIALRNAADSAALEKALTPEVPKLRQDANNAVIAGLQEDPTTRAAKEQLAKSMGVPLNTPLLNEAIAKARADLALGGKLSVDTQNAVTRRGLATSGAVTGGLGLGRDIVARDLGLSSYGIQQDRLGAAFQGGAMEHSLATDNATNMLNRIQLLNTINSNQRSYALGAAQYGEGVRQPQVGLDPSSIANIAVGNSNNAGAAAANQANIYGQQGSNWANMAGQLGGAALLSYKGAKTS